MTLNTYRPGDRVLVTTDDVKGSGTISHIDYPSLYTHYFLPIQVELDQPHTLPDTNNRQTLYRVNLKEIMPEE